MQIIDFIKEKFGFSTETFSKTNVDRLSENFSFLKEKFSVTNQPSRVKKEFKINNKAKKIDTISTIKETKVFFIVNKFNYIVKVASRFVNIDYSTPKPIYFLFLSKHDAIDFLYKVAMENPLYFKKSGLGISTFSLKKTFLTIENRKKDTDILLINELKDVETYLGDFKVSTPKYRLFLNNKIRQYAKLSKFLVYRIKSLPRKNQTTDNIFLKAEDAVNFWDNYIINCTGMKKKRLVLEMCLMPYEEVKNLVLKGSTLK